MLTQPRDFGVSKLLSFYKSHNEIISFNHPGVCRIELSNASCLIVVCKGGSVEFTDYSNATRVRKFGTAYTR